MYVRQILQRLAAPSALRYLVLILLVALVTGASWMNYLHSEEPFYRGDWPFLAYILATPIWIAFAVFERRRLIWRLMLTCSPALLPLANLVYAIFDGDSADQGIAVYYSLFVLGGFSLACFVGVVAAIVYRPGESHSINLVGRVADDGRPIVNP